ncbi:MAG TPA: hypothetical protein VGK67_08895 [Myxococcales bacterium]|jgi:hypothetical protein
MSPHRLLFTLALAAAAPACSGWLSDADAQRLVRAYDDKLVEAYRTGDEKIVDPLVGEEEGKKLLGLIGVKLDMGLTLEATLKELKWLGVERPPSGEVHVLTEERWHYRDRKVGSGETVGQESDDHYFMRYALRKVEGRWVVGAVSFEHPPSVGRQTAPNTASPAVFHGMPAAGEQPR